METATIELMKQMADDAKKAEALVEDDTCLGGLVMVLSNPDSKIVTSSLETLIKLAHWPNHRPHMKKFLGMMDQLKMLISQSCPSIKQLAKKLHDSLQGETCMVAVPLMDTSNHMNRSNRPQKSRRRNSFFVGGSAKGKSVVLEIQEISSKSDTEQIRDSVVKVKGVISITFDIKKKRCLMRTKNELRPEIIARKIFADTGMNPEQVIKDEKGEESYVSFIVGPANGDKENIAMPDYPEESPIKGDTNIVPMDQANKENENKWKFVKTVGSFLTNSFYW